MFLYIYRGDYRTGKRLNMRRIIPYIASYFQNDRIWLRRTKPNKRDYQILVAVDDSASMNENECNQVHISRIGRLSVGIHAYQPYTNETAPNSFLETWFCICQNAETPMHYHACNLQHKMYMELWIRSSK